MPTSTRRILFNPGPTNVHADVRNALSNYDFNHRDRIFVEVFTRIRDKLCMLVCGTGEHDVVPFTASGTGANEAAISALSGRVLVLKAGRYSGRLEQIAKRVGLEVRTIEFSPFSGVDVGQVEQAISENPDVNAVLFAHHETTTGLLAPLADLCRLARNSSILTMVDGISSIGGHPFNVDIDLVDICTVTTNKCLEAFPGLSFVIARRDWLSSTQRKSRSLYFDIYEQWFELGRTGRPQYTAAVQLAFAADAALSRLAEETVLGRSARYRRMKDHLSAGLRARNFVLPDFTGVEEANILQLVVKPSWFDFEEFSRFCDVRGISVYTDEQTLANGYFFIALLGAIDLAEVDILLDVMDQYLGTSRSYR